MLAHDLLPALDRLLRVCPAAPAHPTGAAALSSVRAAATKSTSMRTRLLHAGFGPVHPRRRRRGSPRGSRLEPASSPVLVVGSTVIDPTPTPMKEWAIRQFGTHDKTVLVGSVLAGVLLLAAVAGLLAQRRFAYGAALLVVLTAIPAVAALSRPGAEATDVSQRRRRPGRCRLPRLAGARGTAHACARRRRRRR